MTFRAGYCLEPKSVSQGLRADDGKFDHCPAQADIQQRVLNLAICADKQHSVDLKALRPVDVFTDHLAGCSRSLLPGDKIAMSAQRVTSGAVGGFHQNG